MATQVVKKFPAFYGKVHYHVQKSPPLVPVLSQMHSVHTLPPYAPKIHSYIILPPRSRYSKWEY
jgi:hypothetical protein